MSSAFGRRIGFGAAALLMAVGGLASLAPAAQAAGVDLYMAPTGVNTGNCQTQAAPCSSMSYVQSQVSGGATVHLAAGEYVPDTNFLAIPNVTYVGPQAGVAAQGRTNAAAEAIFLVSSGGFGFIVQADGIVMDGLRFQSQSGAGDGSFGIYNLNPMVARNLVFTNILTGLYAGSGINLSNSTFDTNNDAMYATGTSTVVDKVRFSPPGVYAGLVNGANGPATVTNSSFTAGTYGFLTYAGASTVELHGNSFSPSIPNGMYSDGSTVDATNNWWGCNTGPNTSGCSTVVGPGAAAATSSPRLILTATATPDHVASGGTSAIAATLRVNSAGTDTGYSPVGLTATFSSDLGSIPSSPVRFGADGDAEADFTAPVPAGTSTVTASAGNATVNVPVTNSGPVPVNATPPGTTSAATPPAVGVPVSRVPGTWTRSPTGFAYQWRLCGAAGNDCADIPGATDPTYTPVTGDLGSTLRVQETASNAAGPATGPATSDATAPVIFDAPHMLVRPAVTAQTTTGSTMTAEHGTWSGSPTFTYQWMRCPAGGDPCDPIAGATGATHVVVDADAGSTLRIVVTATNAVGVTTARSFPTPIVGTPRMDVRPTVTGQTTTGATLTGASGTWAGSPSFAFQWTRCDASGDPCNPIAGATASTYVIASADIGSTLRLTVTATNAGGSTFARSFPTEKIGKPTMTVRPSVTGDTTVGATLAASDGTWTGSPTLTYEWTRCDPSGDPCSPVAGATNNTYVLAGEDVGKTLRIIVTATNAGGTTTQRSFPTATVNAPVMTVRPTVSGSISIGSTVTGTDGTWTMSPTSFSYQWLRCDATGDPCTPIAAATSSTYQIGSADTGHTLRINVTAGNAAGNATVRSLPTPIAGLYSFIDRPAVAGPTTMGSTLTATNGTWTGSPASYAYQWLRCDASGDPCAPIADATGNTYVIADADAGDTIRVRVTTSNEAGSVSVRSFPTAVVGRPAMTVRPTATGATTTGSTLTAVDGSWTGSPSFAYQWARCDASGDPCSPIPDATNGTYLVTGDDVGHTLRIMVTATNAGGSTTARSFPTTVASGS